MKVKIAAGAEFDVMTAKEMRKEVDEVMKSWFVEVGRGDKYKRFATFGDITAGATLEIGTDLNRPVVGPAPGFVWAVRRLAFVNYNPAAPETLSLYVGAADSSSMVKPTLATFESFDAGQLVLHSGEHLVVTGTALASTGRVWMTGQARELPANLAWRLG